MDARKVNPTPTLRCPRCKNPFKLPLDKVGLRARCKSCNCKFRVLMNLDGGFDIKLLDVRDQSPAEVETIDQKPEAEEDDRTVTGKLVKGRKPPVDDTFDGRPTRHGKSMTNGPRRSPARDEVEEGSSKGWLLILLVLLVLGGAGGGAYWWFYLRDKGTPATDVVSLGRYGGIEIGTTGVKMLAVEYFNTDAGVRYRLLEEPNDFNTNIGELKPGATEFDPPAFRDTVNHVGDFYKKLRDMGIPAENIHVACSSGVLAPFAENLQKPNKEKLAKALKEKTTKDPDFIDSRDEAKYGFQAIVPKSDWPEAVLIDIGGNNIKGGGSDKRGNFMDFNVNAGVSMFEKGVTKAKLPGEDFRTAAERQVVPLIKNPLNSDLSRAIDLTTRKKVYLIGAISWAMPSMVRPADFYADAGSDKPTYRRPVKFDNFAEFHLLVAYNSPADVKAAVEKKITGKDPWAVEARENLDKIQKVFRNPDRLTAGAKILTALADTFHLKDSDKEIYSFRYGHVAWLLGYVGDKSGHIK